MALSLSVGYQRLVRVVAAITKITTKDFSTTLLMDISKQFCAKSFLTTTAVKLFTVVSLEKVLY